VKTLVAGELPAGEYSIHWQGDDKYHQLVASGVYYLVIYAGRSKTYQKLVLIR
jgi:hypothetical protein